MSPYFLVGLTLALYLSLIPYYYQQIGLNGDEPHYVAMAKSLVAHHTLNLQQFYQNHEWLAFYPSDHFDFHGTANSTPDHMISIHQPGFSILLAPFYAVAQHYNLREGLMVLSSLIGTLIVYNIYLLVLEHAPNSKKLAFLIATIFAVTYPVIILSHLMFSDIAAALLVIYGFRGKTWWLRLLAIAYLPWIHLKYFAVMFILIAKTWNDFPKYRYMLAAISLLSIIGFSLFSKSMYLSYIPFGNISAAGGVGTPKGILWLLIERTGGILNYSPFLIVALLGLAYYFCHYRKEAIFWSLAVLAVLIPNGIFNDWAGGMSTPARYLAPVVPLLALPIAFALYYVRPKWVVSIIFIVLFALSIIVTIRGVTNPISLYLDRPDNIAAIFADHTHIQIYKLFPDASSSSFAPYAFSWVGSFAILTVGGYYLSRPRIAKKSKSVVK